MKKANQLEAKPQTAKTSAP